MHTSVCQYGIAGGIATCEILQLEYTGEKALYTGGQCQLF